MITGGANYITINGDMDSPLIGTYHLHPEVVESNLREMYEHGQRKLCLMLWFAPVNFPAAHDNLWHHVCNSYGGVLCVQHQNNVANLLAAIEAAGFYEVIFRFGAQGNAMDSQWETWDAGQFNENWNFIKSVRDHVTAHNGGLNVIFDLGVEHANERMNEPIHGLYCRRLWRLYTDLYGSSDSCAFTILHGGGGLQSMLHLFRLAKLPLPSSYCFDSYDYEYQTLTSAAAMLASYREGAKPVYLSETNYNDATGYADVKRAVSETGLNFKGIIQWPKVRDTDDLFHPDASLKTFYRPSADQSHSDFPDVFCKRYDNYLVER